MNKQVLILVAAACTTAIWSFVHTATPTNYTITAPMNRPEVQGFVTVGANDPVRPLDMGMQARPVPAQPTVSPMMQMAINHFKGMYNNVTESTAVEEKRQLRELTRQCRLSQDAQDDFERILTSAYQSGIQMGMQLALKSTGQFMRAGLDAMGEQLKSMQSMSQSSR